MTFNEATAAQFKEAYHLLDSQIDFWRQKDSLPEILQDSQLVGLIGEEQRELVVRFLYLPWTKVKGFQNLGVVRRADLMAYKDNPKRIPNWVIAAIYGHLSNISKKNLTVDSPLAFIRDNMDIIAGSSIGNELGFNGNSINYYCQKGYDKFKEAARNKKIYELLFGGFCEFKPLKQKNLSNPLNYAR